MVAPMSPAQTALLEGPFRWPVPLAAVLLAALAWVGLDVLAARLPKGSTTRLLLRRARLSVALTLLLAGLLGWLHGQLERLGWDLPSDGQGVRDALLTLEQLTTSITVLALHASHRPEDTPRVREVFDQLLGVIHRAEADMAVFDLP